MKVFSIIILMFTLLGCKQDVVPDYQVSNEEVLRLVEPGNYWVSLEEIVSSDKDYLLVDLRTRASYLQGHFQDAINIPANELLQRDHMILFEDQQKTIVLYSEQPQKAIAPWTLLQQLGVNNVQVLSAGWDASTGAATLYQPEQAADFTLLQQQALEQFQKELKANQYVPPKPVKKVIPKKKKKKEEEEEGC